MPLSDGGTYLSRPYNNGANVVYGKPKKTFEANSVTTSLPSSEMGIPIPFVTGVQIVRGNRVWDGNAKVIWKTKTEVIPETTSTTADDGEVTTTTTTTTIKTKYADGITCDIMVLLCLGPNVRLRKILNGELAVWTGRTGFARQQLTMPASNSGMSGATVWFSGGALDQAPEPNLETFVPNAPGFPGMAYVFIKNFRADKFTGGLTFEVERAPAFNAGLETVVNVNGDVNVVDLIGEVITNPWGGAGVDMADLDTGLTSTFIKAKEWARDESVYGTLLIEQHTTAIQVLEELSAMLDCVIYQSPNTQKLSISVFRDRLEASGQLSLAERVISDEDGISEWAKSGWNETVDGLLVNFPARDKFYSNDPLPIRNGLARNVAGRGRQLKTLELPYVPDRKIAQTIGKRLMKEEGIPTFGFQVKTNRLAAYAFPGKIVTITDETLGLFGVRVNVVECNREELESNAVTLLVRQSAFLDNSTIIDDLDELPTPPPSTIDTLPRPPQNTFALDTPYYFVRGRGLTVDPMDFAEPHGFPIILATPANGAQTSYAAKLVTYPGVSGAVSMTAVNKYPYPAYGLLSADLSQFAGLSNGIISTLRISKIAHTDDDFVRQTLAANSGLRFLMIGEEICAYESATIDGNEYVLSNVHRALIDTAPMAHAAGTVCYIITNNFRNVSSIPIPHETLSTYNPRFDVEGYNAGGAASGAPVLHIGAFYFARHRNIAPPRPHAAKVDGVRSGAGYAVGDTIDVTWKTRYRKAAGVTLFADAAERGDYIHDGPEYQTHYVEFVDSRGNTYNAVETVTPQFTPENALTVTVPFMFNGPAHLIVRSVFNGQESMFDDWVPLGDITGGISGGWNRDWNYQWNEAI